MAFRHGKNTKVALDQYNLTSFLNEASSTASSETAQASVFGDGATKYVLGLKDGTATLSGLFDHNGSDAIEDVLAPLIGASSASNLTYLSTGDQDGPGSPATLLSVRETNYETSSPVSDVVSVSAEFQGDGGIDHGVYLRAARKGSTEFDETSAGNTESSASVDNGSSTSDGGVAHLHVVDNTMDAATTIEVQHSSDDSTWADLTTFSDVAAGTNETQREVVTGTVDRYLRSQVDASGSASGTIEVAVAFARR